MSKITRLLVSLACAAALVTGSAVAAPAADAAASKTSAGGLLAKLPVKAEGHAGSYDRARFRLWIDADRDGLDTRAEVLKAESSKAVGLSSSGTVKTGRWVSRYDGKTFTVASKLDIDHLVPLEEAWTSGAWNWTAKRREAYANDLGFGVDLIAVSAHANRSKGDKDPTAYLPTRASYRCAYVRNWIAVKYRWHLSVDSAERAALRSDLHRYCSSMQVTRPGKPSIATLVGAGSGSGSSAGGSGTPAPTATPKPTGGTDPDYGTCANAKAHHAHTPYTRGVDPEYAFYQDRDSDGVVCE